MISILQIHITVTAILYVLNFMKKNFLSTSFSHSFCIVIIIFIIYFLKFQCIFLPFSSFLSLHLYISSGCNSFYCLVPLIRFFLPFFSISLFFPSSPFFHPSHYFLSSFLSSPSLYVFAKRVDIEWQSLISYIKTATNKIRITTTKTITTTANIHTSHKMVYNSPSHSSISTDHERCYVGTLLFNRFKQSLLLTHKDSVILKHIINQIGLTNDSLVEFHL